MTVGVFKAIFGKEDKGLKPLLLPETLIMVDDRFCKDENDTENCRGPLEINGKKHYVNFVCRHYMTASWYRWDLTLLFPTI